MLSEYELSPQPLPTPTAKDYEFNTRNTINNKPLIIFDINNANKIEKSVELSDDFNNRFSVIINSDYQYFSQLSEYIKIILKYHNIEVHNIEGKNSSKNYGVQRENHSDTHITLNINLNNKNIITLQEYISLFGIANSMDANSMDANSTNGIANDSDFKCISVNHVIKLIYDLTICLNTLKDLELSILKINVNDFHVVIPNTIYHKAINKNILPDDIISYINDIVFIYTGSVSNHLYPLQDKDKIHIETPIEFSNINDYLSPEIISFNKNNKTLPHNFNIKTSYYIIALFIIDLLFGTTTQDKSDPMSLMSSEKLLTLLEPLYYTKLYYFLLRCLQPNINDRYFLFV